jgi:hypothetical protein
MLVEGSKTTHEIAHGLEPLLIIRPFDDESTLDLDLSKRERSAIRLGRLRGLRRGRAFAKAVCVMIARKLRFVKTRQESVTI